MRVLDAEMRLDAGGAPRILLLALRPVHNAALSRKRMLQEYPCMTGFEQTSRTEWVRSLFSSAPKKESGAKLTHRTGGEQKGRCTRVSVNLPAASLSLGPS